MADLSGMDIGRYHLVDRLGQGGMAVVYRAFDTRLERAVALKIIRTETLEPDIVNQMLQRFEREARSLAKLMHPNIIPIFDYGEYQGSPYLVMPYISGGTLKQRTGTPMPYREAAHLLAPIARALEYAHQREIIHRDVKPANILISEEGLPLLADFGVAKILAVESGNTLTSTGTGIGTPEYMAPEQWENRVVPQTDIYALGIVFYELVTGKKPFTADTPAAIFRMVYMDPLPRPRQFVPDLPQEVEGVLFKATAKRASERYAGMGEFAAALEKLAAGLPPAAPARVLEQTQVDQTRPARRGSSAATWPEPVRATPAAAVPLHPARRPPRWLLPVGLGLGVLILAVGVILLIQAGGALPASELPAAGPSLAPGETQEPVPADTDPPVSEPGNGAAYVSEADAMPLLAVPAGSFRMGADKVYSQTPSHMVWLDEFYIDQTDVTNGMFARFVEATGYKTDAEKLGSGYVVNQNDQSTGGAGIVPWANWLHPLGPGSDLAGLELRPVVQVSWNDAAAYCDWAGRRLPTEAEWEKAARGDDGRLYPWGNEPPNLTLLNYHKNLNTSSDVGSYPSGASPYGALDMAGNVYQWVYDWYDASYYLSQTEWINPQGPLHGDSHILKGSSWNTSEDSDLRPPVRIPWSPSSSSNLIGFRCVQ